MLHYVVELFFDETEQNSIKGIISARTEKDVDKYYDWNLEEVIPETLFETIDHITMYKINPKEVTRLRREGVLFDVVAEKW